jgi:Tol biopolymer transport system component
MKRPLLLIALLVSAPQATAQNPGVAHLPVIRPTMTVLGDIRDNAFGGGRFLNDAALSPNGRLIAFTVRDELRMWDTVTRTESLLLAGGAHAFTWAPKGDAIVMTHRDPQDPDRYLWTIRVDPLSGKALEPPRLVSRMSINHAPFFSPDERLIAFAQATSEPDGSSLVVVPAAGGPERILASGLDIRAIRWSPDGSAIHYVAYADSSSATRQEFRVSLEGGAPALVGTPDDAWPLLRDATTGRVLATVAVPADVAVTDWSGRNEVAGVREVFPRGLRVVRLADGMARDLVDTTAEVGVPEWFPGGNRIAIVIRRNGTTSLLTERTDGSDLRMFPFTRLPLFNGVGVVNAQLQVSPDGRFAAFLGDQQETIELMDLASGQQRTLVAMKGDGTAAQGQGIGQLVWSDESKSIRYLSGIWTSEHRAVHEVTLSGRDTVIRPLPKSLYPAPTAWFPANSVGSHLTHPDVVALLGGPELTFVPLDGGPPRVVFPKPVRTDLSALSPDRHTLAMMPAAGPNSQAGAQATLLSLEDLSTRNILLPFIQIAGIFWHPDGQRFFVLGREKGRGPVSVYAVPVNGGVPRIVASVGSSRHESALAVSPDGLFIAFTVAGTPMATFLKLDFSRPAALASSSK